VKSTVLIGIIIGIVVVIGITVVIGLTYSSFYGKISGSNSALPIKSSSVRSIYDLSLSIEIPKDSFKKGEEILATFELTNVGSSTRSFIIHGNGMFALVIYDSEKKIIHQISDRETRSPILGNTGTKDTAVLEIDKSLEETLKWDQSYMSDQGKVTAKPGTYYLQGVFSGSIKNMGKNEPLGVRPLEQDILQTELVKIQIT